MKPHNIKKAAAFLPSQQNLQKIITKVQMLEVLQTHFAPLLEPNIAKYCQVANLTDEYCLVLIAANGSVATQLQLLTPDLLIRCKQHPELKKIRAIKCKVRPFSTTRATKSSQKMSLLSPQAAQIISDNAKSIEDPNLRASLAKIAQHVAEEIED